MTLQQTIATADTLDELLRAPEGAVIEAPVSVWEEVGVDLDEKVADWDDVTPGEDGSD